MLSKMGSTCGRCFEWANKWSVDNFDKTADHMVVHGLVTNASGKTFAHAWIELGNKIFDNTVGEKGISKKAFYDGLKPQKIKKYDPIEALQTWLKAKHHGPWHKI